MKINAILYKNDITYKKNLNIEAIYDKTIPSLKYIEDKTEVELTFLLSKLTYIRVNSEYTFKLVIKGSKESKSSMYLHDIKKELPIKVLEGSYSIRTDKITIIYKLESEEDITNTIVIELLGE